MLIQHSLFEQSGIDLRSPRQIEINNLYVEKGFDFEPIFREALAKILKDDTPEHYRGRGYDAYHMNWAIIGLLKESYPTHMKLDEEKRNYFLLDKHVRIYFKKLDSRHRPENVVTDHVISLNTMQMLFQEQETTILYAGYRLRDDEFWDDFAGCFLVEMKTLKRTNWVSKLEDLAYEISQKKNISTPIFKADIPDSITFTVNESKKTQNK